MKPAMGSIRPRRVRVALGAGIVLAALAAGAGRAAAQTVYCVSLSGLDSNPGTIDAPFRSVQRGVDALAAPGDTVMLRGGRYVGPVLLAQKHGTAAQPMVLTSYPGERAFIDNSVSMTSVSRQVWEPGLRNDPNAHPDEFVSTRTFAEDFVNRGAFLSQKVHQRLVTYSRLEDLRADNETFEQIVRPGDSRPGPRVYEACEASDPDAECQPFPDCTPYPACAPKILNRYKLAGYRFPWVYMGPGLWFNPVSRRVHIRLSHTHNMVAGLEDYAGSTDPRTVKLAIANKEMYTLRAAESSYLLVRNVTIRHGGEETIELVNTDHVTFDHVNVSAGTRGVRTGKITNTVFRHCLFDGGVPPWYFRTDRKNEYYFLQSGQMVLNGLGSKTVDTLMVGSSADVATRIESSEFVNGHDLYLAGTDVEFHHNWIRNLHDEALFLDGYEVSNARIHDNVIQQTLSAISVAGVRVGGPRYIYRNIVDLRLPTAGFRPRNAIDRDVWRYGSMFKSNLPDGPYDLFQNTFIVTRQDAQAS